MKKKENPDRYKLDWSLNIDNWNVTFHAITELDTLENLKEKYKTTIQQMEDWNKMIGTDFEKAKASRKKKDKEYIVKIKDIDGAKKKKSDTNHRVIETSPLTKSWRK